jgi:hypothetical protein
MNEITVINDELHYAISLDEVLWGALLMAITLVIHGFGMVSTIRVCNALKRRIDRFEAHSFILGLGVLIIAAWMIIVVDLVETSVWAGFYVLMGAMSNFSQAYYHALVNFCTLDSGYLPLHWRLLEGMLGLAGWLTLAWSTGVLYMLAQDFQDRALHRGGARRGTSGGQSACAAQDRPADSERA